MKTNKPCELRWLYSAQNSNIFSKPAEFGYFLTAGSLGRQADLSKRLNRDILRIPMKDAVSTLKNDINFLIR
jgi:hypothetical protein